MKTLRLVALSFVLASLALSCGCTKSTTPTVIEGPAEDTYIDPSE